MTIIFMIIIMKINIIGNIIWYIIVFHVDKRNFHRRLILNRSTIKSELV